MYPEILKSHIIKCKSATDKPFGVNLPLLYPDIDKHISIIIEEKVPIVFTSAGNPGKYTSFLKNNGITVVHVIANLKFAKKAEEAGVDALVAEGFEAGGHNGREETTTMSLVPLIRKHTNIPLIAAGGIGTGQAMAAALCLGADAVQVGSRFVATNESSAHQNFKNSVIKAGDGSTELTLKELTPVRLLKNNFYNKVQELYQKDASAEELAELLGRGRAKKGMFEGDLDDGELEIGQVAAQINELIPAKQVVNELMSDCRKTLSEKNNLFNN
jgi:enoyl-[acyl-carrier protein] reductase II